MGLCSLSSVTGEREELELLFKLRLRRKRSTRDFFQRAEHEGMSGSCLRHVCSLGRVTLLLPCAALVEQVQFAPACLKSEEAQRLSEQPGGSHAGEGCGECPCLSGGPRSWGSGRLQLLSCGTEGGSKSPLLLQCPGGRGSQPLSLEQLCSLSHRCPCSQQVPGFVTAGQCPAAALTQKTQGQVWQPHLASLPNLELPFQGPQSIPGAREVVGTQDSWGQRQREGAATSPPPLNSCGSSGLQT